MPSATCLDGTIALSPAAAGMWQSGGKAFCWSPNFFQEQLNGSPEQVFRVLTVPKKAIKAFCFSATYQSPCRAKCWGSEVPAVELEITNQDSQTACTHIEATRSDHASRGSHEQLQDHQCGTGASLPSHAASHGHVHVEPNVDDVFANTSVWKEHSPETQGRCAGYKKPLEPPFTADDRLLSWDGNADMGQSPCEVEASQSSGVPSAAFSNAHAANYCNGIELVDMEDHHISLNHGGESCTSHNRVIDEQASGRMGGTCSHVDKQGFEHGNKDEEAVNPSTVSMNAKASINSACRIAAVRMPTYRAPMYLQDSLRDTICYLRSLGVDCDKLFQVEPKVKSCTVKQIKALASALEGYGLECKDAGRVFNLCPRVLLLDPEKDLEVATSFLFKEAGLSPKDFGKVIRRCPRLLVYDLDTELRPTLSFLRTLGFTRMGYSIANNPSLLSYGVKSRILPRLRLLESWGFTYREAAAMVVRFPALLNYNAVENLQCKYDYLIHEIKAGKKDLLAFPQYFGYSLESRIRPRHQRIAKLNVPLSIQAMLTLSDFEFNAKFPSVDGAWSMRMKDEVSVSLYESIEAKLHESNRMLVKSTSFENSETQVLVSV